LGSSYKRIMSFARIFRVIALSVLAMMLVLRVGPVCEAAANAAAPPAVVHDAMVGCEQPSGKPARKSSAAACASACVATDPLRTGDATRPMLAAVSPIASVRPDLEGRTGGPAPPPPRTA
jgi:hypothetical protein